MMTVLNNNAQLLCTRRNQGLYIHKTKLSITCQDYLWFAKSRKNMHVITFHLWKICSQRWLHQFL